MEYAFSPYSNDNLPNSVGLFIIADSKSTISSLQETTADLPSGWPARFISKDVY